MEKLEKNAKKHTFCLSHVALFVPKTPVLDGTILLNIVCYGCHCEACGARPLKSCCNVLYVDTEP